MSTFEVKVVKIEAIEPIVNADAIEVAMVGDYRSVVRKGQYNVGNLAVYIPEAAILPSELIRDMGLEGKLAGTNKNRVKAVKLRGCLSQGLLYPVDSGSDCGGPFINLPTEDGIGTMLPVVEGQDVTQELGITKYEPVIPASMSGEVYNAGMHITVAYDIENIKKFPTVLVEGEEVVMTEKLHGTFCGIGIVPEVDYNDNHLGGNILVFSKGLGAGGLCFKHNEVNKNNVYLRVLTELGVFDKINKFTFTIDRPVFILGEVFGIGVQDLTYEMPQSFRVFDMCMGYRGNQEYFGYDLMKQTAEGFGLDLVPLIYRGPFSKEAMMQHTLGRETVSGKQAHMREGVVVKPVVERRASELGRVILKSVSEEYLLRKGKTTEFN